MPAPVNIQDSLKGTIARVTKFGQLVVAPLDYSIPIERELDAINTAFNFIEPEAGHSIVITAILVSANKDVSVTDPADVNIFEADSITSLIPAPGIIRPQMVRSTNLPLTPLNLIIPEGKWVNATTTDDVIILTIMFYRVPAENI